MTRRLNVEVFFTFLFFNEKIFKPRAKGHTIKLGTLEHGTTERGKPAEHRNTGGNNGILAEQLEYHGIVKHVKSSIKTHLHHNSSHKFF